LNLVRPGASPGFNYATLVRPQLNALNSIQQLNQQAWTNQQAITQLRDQPGVPTTGHVSAFMNYGGYFMNNTGSGGGSRVGLSPGTGSLGTGAGFGRPQSSRGGTGRPAGR
jgi:hypothetical protein